MTIQDFQLKAATASNEEEIDEICIKWIRDLAKGYGKEGKVATALLDQIKILLEI